MGEERCNSGKWKFLLPALKDFDILSSCSGRVSVGTGRLTWTTASPRKRISSTRKRLNTLTRQRGMAKNPRSFRWIVHSELPWRKGDVSASEPTHCPSQSGSGIPGSSLAAHPGSTATKSGMRTRCSPQTRSIGVVPRAAAGREPSKHQRSPGASRPTASGSSFGVGSAEAPSHGHRHEVIRDGSIRSCFSFQKNTN